MKASGVLEKAAELILRGHCKGDLAIDADGKRVDHLSDRAVAYCAVGALNAAGYNKVGSWSADQLARLVIDDGGFIAGWNNAPERTAGEVVAAFDAARVLALQEEGLEPEDVL